MAPFIVVAIIAAGLFGSGTVIKPQNPVVGTTLQAAGIGTLAGGAIGTIGGVGAALGTATMAQTVTATAIAGGVIGTSAGIVYSTDLSSPITHHTR